MNRNTLRLYALCALILFLAEAADAGEWPTDYAGMRTKAIHFAGRLVCLVNNISPYVILIFMAIGGVKYIMADDASEAMMAKRMVMDGLVGGFIILVFVAFAEAMGVPEYC